MQLSVLAAIGSLVASAIAVPVDGPVNPIEARYPHVQPAAIMHARTYLNTTSTAPPTTTPTSGPACAGSTEYCCTSAAIAGVINCASVLGGPSVAIPITIPSKRDLVTRASACPAGQTSLCCTTNALLSVITCTDIANGITVTAPITIG